MCITTARAAVSEEGGSKGGAWLEKKTPASVQRAWQLDKKLGSPAWEDWQETLVLE
jgi:hypothetical protein